MKVKYTDFCLNPALRGTTVHLPQHRAVALIDSGAAVEVPMARRGTTEWLRDMKERSEAFNPTPLDHATVSWSITQGAMSQRYGITAKCSRSNCAQFCFTGRPDSLLPGTSYYIEHLEFIHSCGAGAPDRVPQAICDQYCKLFKPAANLSNDEAAYYRAAAPQVSKPLNWSTFAGPTTGALVEGSEAQDKMQFLPNPGDGQRVELKTFVLPVKE